MDADERYVRERWLPEYLNVAPYVNAPDHLCIVIRGTRFVNYPAGESEAWSAARAFTEEREEQIRLVEEEVAVATFTVEEMSECRWAEASKRILAARQAALAELKKGMK